MTVPLIVQKGLTRALKVLVGPIIPAIPSSPPFRRLTAFAAARRGPFAIPYGKTLVLVPLRKGIDERMSVSEHDGIVAREIGGMMRGLGFRDDKDWAIRELSEPLSDSDRQENLIIICGSNPMYWEMLRKDPQILGGITYRAASRREDRRFLLNGNEFGWDDNKDFAILAVRANPFKASKRVIFVIGLTEMGTRGAGRVFALPEYESLRAEIDELATKRGEVTVLLKVEYPPHRRTVSGVQLAKAGDGATSAAEGRLLPINADTSALNRVYVSLKQNPRAVRWSNVVVEVTYTREFDIKFKREWTWEWAGSDVIVQGIDNEADEDLPAIEQLEFDVRTVQPSDGDIVALAAMNGLRHKAFLLFPIPSIVANDPARRYVAVSKWPRAGKALKLRHIADETSYRTPAHLVGPIDRVTSRIVFDIVDATFSVTALCAGVPPAATSGVFSIAHPFVYVETNVPADRELKFVVHRLT